MLVHVLQALQMWNLVMQIIQTFWSWVVVKVGLNFLFQFVYSDTFPSPSSSDAQLILFDLNIKGLNNSLKRIQFL